MKRKITWIRIADSVIHLVLGAVLIMFAGAWAVGGIIIFDKFIQFYNAYVTDIINPSVFVGMAPVIIFVSALFVYIILIYKMLGAIYRVNLVARYFDKRKARLLKKGHEVAV